ncbi:dockerin type I repeat-containing protein [uncultured Ruminococcus sp.]|uniref:dockerin type I repeat-containing protein n=1 Tax=uncultured Ruminococcus sp. TaxID=165186 RepID=UPI002616E92C|nr:dockerin type I repeat-containing protein [uncultured Ruminococcus sp.]
MKTRKAISFLTAAVMAVSALPILSVSAEESTYALGDVDMDGYITGHDAAMVSRYVLDESYTLTEEQLALADVNADGAVNQADADWIFENRMYMLGDMLKDGTSDYTISLGTSFGIAMKVYAWESVCKPVNVIETPIPDMPHLYGYGISGREPGSAIVEICEGETQEWRTLDPTEDEAIYNELLRLTWLEDYDCALTQMEYNLLDIDGNNEISMDDVVLLMGMYVEDAVGRDISELYFGDGKYYVDRDSIGSRVQFGE